MIVCQGDVHHWTGDNLIASHDGLILYSMHAENRTLGRVENGSSKKRSESPPVRNSERSPLHILNRYFSVLSFFGQLIHFLNIQKKYDFELMEFKILTVSNNWHHQAGWGGDSDRDVDVISLYYLVAINNGVYDRVFLEGQDRSLHKEGHEAKFSTVFFEEILTQILNEANITFRAC